MGTPKEDLKACYLFIRGKRLEIENKILRREMGKLQRKLLAMEGQEDFIKFSPSHVDPGKQME